MGRAGAGGGGHRSSGGGHRSHRSGGGHRVGGSSHRAGSSSSHSYGSSHSYYSGSSGYRRSYYHGGTYYSTTTNVITTVVVVFIMFGVFINLAGSFIGSIQSAPRSTVVREKIPTKTAYMNDCVIDEIGWVESTSYVSRGLKEFWEETGVQPFIYLRKYDPTLVSDDQKEQWALDYYDKTFDQENVLLFVYFAEFNTDYDVGYMAYANGYETSTVMDAEAIDIFWNYVDSNWTSSKETDDVLVDMFTSTSNAIMHVSTTNKDIIKDLIVFTIVAVIFMSVIVIIMISHKRAREKAAEDERILNTPLDSFNTTDNLEDKYLK